MVPKFRYDEKAGTCPPCAIMWNLEIAEQWDKDHPQKYFGQTAIQIFHKHNPPVPRLKKLTLFQRLRRWISLKTDLHLKRINTSYKKEENGKQHGNR